MPKPVLLIIDDDPEVLKAVERDLRRQYAVNYRVLSADSGPAGLALLDRLRQRGETVALFLVDYRMPQMSGIEFLAQAISVFPNAKRVLLTAYSDTEAAIRAINEIKLNHYLLKPWDPPERNLYPVLDDLLGDWIASYRPPFEGLRVLGTRWSRRSFELREFLARNQVPYHWLDAEAADRDPDVQRAMDMVAPEERHFPVVVFQDGRCLCDPSFAEVAGRIGLQTRAGAESYDLIILGGGPAGLAAAVYGASEGLHAVIVEKEAPGGQAGLSARIENYLGFPSGLSGSDLARRAVTQARRFGAEILAPQEAVGLRIQDPYRVVKLADGTEIYSEALLIATGVQWRKLDVPGMDRLTGAGVYYGAGSTEAVSCRGENVYIVGGANSAGQAALYFSRYAQRVIMLVRSKSLAATMSQYLIDEIERTGNIEVQFQTQVVEVHGEEHLEAITVECGISNTRDRVNACALFIFIGAQPRTEWLDGIVARDDKGFILTGQSLLRDGKPPKTWTLDRTPGLLETSVPGIFAVGDVRHGSVKRVASGVGEGSIAVQF
ncbi:MAG TPA: FAD-dependent oxidoreductase, partial [Bryobacteraceae bacterium]|nr:FAD-dependent oxidoreductase [Bryobacteraceae bacterium]